MLPPNFNHRSAAHFIQSLRDSRGARTVGLGMLCGFLLAAVTMSQQLTIETVRNMCYTRNDRRVPLRRIQDTTAVFFQSKLSCDVDGSPNAYHPLDDRLSLDLIGSAGGTREGDRPDGSLLTQPSSDIVVWVGGKPYIQPEGEFKGFYVSETTLQNRALPVIDPTRYLDARHTQYIVLPDGMVPEAKIGDLAIVYDPVAKTVAAAVYGDIGPRSESGEAALATLQRLGMAATDGKSSPGQLRDDLFFLVFPKSGTRLEQSEPWPYRQSAIDALAKEELTKWGGVERIESILKQDPKGGSIPDSQANGWIYDELAALRKLGLVRMYGFSLPSRIDGGQAGRLPCAPEIVAAAKTGVAAIQSVIEAVELSKIPQSNLAGIAAHMHRLSNIFRKFPVETSDVLEGVLREAARCGALEERVIRAGGS